MARRRFHSAEQNADVSRLRASDDLIETALDQCDRHAVEAVVRTQGEDEHAGAFGQCRIEPPQAVGSCVTPAAGVHDKRVHARPVEVCLKVSREALLI